MYSFANLNNTILLDTPLNNDSSTYKVFGINYLTNLICVHAMNELKRKYRPPKKYNSETPFIKRLENDYMEEQVFLNPFIQVKYFLEEALTFYRKLYIIDVYEDKTNSIVINNSTKFYGTLTSKIYYHLNKIYKYRNDLYLTDFKIDDDKIEIDDLDPESLESIYAVKPKYIMEVNQNLSMKMDNEHPFFDLFKYNVKNFTIYLLEYQMNFNNITFELCWKYLHDYIIEDIKSKDKKCNKTYYIYSKSVNNFKIIESKNKNKFCFITNLNSYYEIKTMYKFKHETCWYELELVDCKSRYNITLNYIYEYVQKKYGSVLNFGAEYFYIPYLDFIDDYRLVL